MALGKRETESKAKKHIVLTQESIDPSENTNPGPVFDVKKNSCRNHCLAKNQTMHNLMARKKKS